jgi:hypothetical protein
MSSASVVSEQIAAVSYRKLFGILDTQTTVTGPNYIKSSFTRATALKKLDWMIFWFTEKRIELPFRCLFISWTRKRFLTKFTFISNKAALSARYSFRDVVLVDDRTSKRKNKTNTRDPENAYKTNGHCSRKITWNAQNSET